MSLHSGFKASGTFTSGFRSSSTFNLLTPQSTTTTSGFRSFAVSHRSRNPPSAADRKCSICAGQGVRGRFICKSHCQDCEGTGEASKQQLLELLAHMCPGDVEVAVLFSALSASKRDDADIALVVVRLFPKALDFASKRLQARQDVIDAAAEGEAVLKQAILSRFANNSIESQRLMEQTAGAAEQWETLTVKKGVLATEKSVCLDLSAAPWDAS